MYRYRDTHLALLLDGTVLSSTAARINPLNNPVSPPCSKAIMLRRRFLQSVAEKAAREKRKREEAMKVGRFEKVGNDWSTYTPPPVT